MQSTRQSAMRGLESSRGHSTFSPARGRRSEADIVESATGSAALPDTHAAFNLDEATATTSAAGARRLNASPVARRLADAHGINLDHVRGTGPYQRVLKVDVLTAIEGQSRTMSTAPAAKAHAPTDRSRGKVIRQQPTRIQRVIAHRMLDAKTTIPEFCVEMEVVLDELAALRETIKRAGVRGGIVPSINDFVVKASALALRRHPRVNGSYREGQFETYSRVNVGIAVVTDDGVIVPTVFDADLRSLGQIADAARDLAERARTGAIDPGELDSGTFTVSNLGMYGVHAVTPVINVPQAAILGVGAARTVLVRVAGKIVDRTVMTLRLTSDHRLLDGAHAAEFLGEIRDLLQRPVLMLL